MATKNRHDRWGNILIVGGGGRLGFFVIADLLRQAECAGSRIISINRSTQAKHRHDGVDYRSVDIRDATAVQNLMQDVRPEIIINVAAPAHHNLLTSKKEMEDTLIRAQTTLLDCARKYHTRVFLSTTSINVVAGYESIDTDETAPLWPESSNAFPYWVYRAQAERLLLAADSPTLRTASIRLALIIGERDYAFVPSMLRTLESGRNGVQIGNNTGKLHTISAREAASAHTLVLRKILEPGDWARGSKGQNVHGEAFNITSARALPFWTMAQIVWRAAGWEGTNKDGTPFKPTIIPKPAAMAIAAVSELITWILSMGRREPEMTRHVVRFCTNQWTYSCEKAKQRLGYVPKDDTEQALQASVAWELAKREEIKSSTG